MSTPQIRFLPATGNRTGERAAAVGFMAPRSIAAVRAFHQSVPQYRVTPLTPLTGLADELGLAAVLVKDESSRFGLGAFKGLGAVYAMARLLAARLAIDDEPLSFPHLRQRAATELGSAITFVTATAGNHGRGVAWAARQFGARAVAVVPRGTERQRIEAIRSEGARVEVRGDGFDGAVRAARRLAEERGWVLLQDTAWEGYEEIPGWIMRGYGTMVAEALEQIAAAGLDPPTHVFLQVGVGSFAAALTAALVGALPRHTPRVLTVEPSGYGGLFAAAESGRRRRLAAHGPTAMSCLACTEISTLAWPVLRDHCAGHFLCDDRVAAAGREALAHPRGEDRAIDSGPSGAVAAGLVKELTRPGGAIEERRAVNLAPDARVLLFSTEGSPGAAGPN